MRNQMKSFENCQRMWLRRVAKVSFSYRVYSPWCHATRATSRTRWQPTRATDSRPLCPSMCSPSSIDRSAWPKRHSPRHSTATLPASVPHSPTPMCSLARAARSSTTNQSRDHLSAIRPSAPTFTTAWSLTSNAFSSPLLIDRSRLLSLFRRE